MEILKNYMFNAFIIIGMIAVCLTLVWYMLKLLNRIFKFTKYIIMYFEYKRNRDLYDLKNKIEISKSGKVSYSCVGDLDRQVEILEKAIQNRIKIRQLREKFSK